MSVGNIIFCVLVGIIVLGVWLYLLWWDEIADTFGETIVLTLAGLVVIGIGEFILYNMLISSNSFSLGDALMSLGSSAVLTMILVIFICFFIYFGTVLPCIILTGKSELNTAGKVCGLFIPLIVFVLFSSWLRSFEPTEPNFLHDILKWLDIIQAVIWIIGSTIVRIYNRNQQNKINNRKKQNELHQEKVAIDNSIKESEEELDGGLKMNNKFKAAAEELFYPSVTAEAPVKKEESVKKDKTVKKEKKVKKEKGNYNSFYKFLLLIPVFLLISYGAMITAIAINVFSAGGEVIPGIETEYAFKGILILVIIYLFRIFSTFKKNSYTKSRALRAIVSVVSCLVSGLFFLGSSMALELVYISPEGIFYILFAFFIVAVLVLKKITGSYLKANRTFSNKLIKILPIGMIICVVGFFIVNLNVQYETGRDNLLKAHNAVNCILTEEKHNVSFGTKKVTELVSFELSNGAKDSVTNYDLKCATVSTLHIYYDRENDYQEGDYLDMSALSAVDGIIRVAVTGVPHVKNVGSLTKATGLLFTDCAVDVPDRIMNTVDELKFENVNTDVEAFARCTPNLYLFDFRSNDGEDINIKALGLPEDIGELRIYGAKLSNTDYISKFYRLAYLEIAAANLISPDITINENSLPILIRLTLDNVDIKNKTEEFTKMGHLDELYITNSGFYDISPLRQLPNLRYVDLSGNNIRYITSLEANKQIEYLKLDNNRIDDISVLANLENLRTLSLNNNNIEDITPISNLHRLEYLYLDNNKIDVLPYFSCESTLRSLSLKNNDIGDISSLNGYKNLSRLGISGNNVTEAQIKLISSRGVSVS